MESVSSKLDAVLPEEDVAVEAEARDRGGPSR